MVAPVALAGLASAFASLAPTLFGDESSGSSASSGRTDTIKSTGTTSNSGRTDTNTVTDSGQTTTTGPRTDVIGGGVNINTSTTGPREDRSTSTTRNSGRTDTQQLMISKEGIDNILRTILEGNQGLASVAKGVKAAGIYDSTTQQSQINDLLTRAAGYAAEKSAALVTTIGESTSTTETVNTIGGQTTVGVQNIGDRTNTIGSQTSTTGPRTQTSTTNVGASTSTESLDQTTVKGPETILTDQEKEGLFGTSGLPSVGTVVKESGKALLGIPKTKWIVCTELHLQGRMDYRSYVVGSAYFATAYDERIKRGYYIWAEPSVAHLRKYPNSRYSRFLEVWFRARAEHIMELKGHGRSRSILNPIAFYATHAFCWILSRTIARNYVPAASSYEQNNVLDGGV